MARNQFSVAVVLLALLIAERAFSQTTTTTIDYTQSGMSNSDCAFQASTKVGGYSHYRIHGGVIVQNGVLLLSSLPSSQNAGTSYSIEYQFRPGYSYNVEVSAASSTQSSLTVAVHKSRTSSSSSCDPDPLASSVGTGTGYVLNQFVESTFKTYALAAFSPTEPLSSLEIAATGGNASLSVLKVASIKITETALSSQPSPTSYWVGVIPGASSCPANSSLITVYMDDEDGAHDNDNDRAGWFGAITSDHNTTFRFCRVDGRQFYPLATTNAVTNHYAVLKLGNTCPNGSTDFYRRFDNEITNNQNSKSTSSGDDSELALIGSRRDINETILRFCLFKAGASTMNEFPALGIDYGVFAAWDFTKAMQTGWVFTDDEDPFLSNKNLNEFGGDNDGQRIVTPTNSNGRNTTLHTAKVRGYPFAPLPPGADLICNYPEDGDNMVAYSVGTMFNGGYRTSGWCSGATSRYFTGDVNGDGKEDLLCNYPENGDTWVLYSAGSGFSGGFLFQNWCTGANSRIRTGDVNGDGKDDLVCNYSDTGANDVAFSTGSGFGGGVQVSGWCSGASSRYFIGDVNGDRHADLICNYPENGANWVLYSAGSTFSGGFLFNGWCTGASSRILAGDVNGDGKDDLICNHSDNGANDVAFSTGSGFGGGVQVSGWCSGATSRYRAGDVNADGRTDLICNYPENGDNWVLYSAGSTFSGGFLFNGWCAGASSRFLTATVD